MNALIVEDVDNVAVATAPIADGECVHFVRHDGAECEFPCVGGVPIYHKVAVRDIAAGEDIVKYGEIIGKAAVDIARGSHVHTHNVADLS